MLPGDPNAVNLLTQFENLTPQVNANPAGNLLQSAQQATNQQQYYNSPPGLATKENETNSSFYKVESITSGSKSE